MSVISSKSYDGLYKEIQRGHKATGSCKADLSVQKIRSLEVELDIELDDCSVIVLSACRCIRQSIKKFGVPLA